MARPKDMALEARRKQEILEAAKRCFIENGFHQTSMREIVSASGLSTGAVYNYFDSKAAVVEAIATQEREALAVLIEQLQKSRDAARGIARLVSTGITYTDQAEAVLTCEVYAEACRNAQVLASVRAYEQPVAQAILEAIRRGQESGVVRRNLPAEVLSEGVQALLDGYLGRLAFLDAKGRRKLAAAAEKVVLALLSAEGA
jgi:AcrR family transcriptional regulator